MEKDNIHVKSIEEQASYLSGKDFWHLQPTRDLADIMVTDGPNGLRVQKGEADHIGLNESEPATCFPTAGTLGASMDPGLVEKIGIAIGQEAAALGVDVVLGPGINHKRNPLCGRNFEYYSEDPLVSGMLGEGFVKGVQSQGVGASLKHFAANNQESARMVNNSIVDERALREIYLAAFERVVKNAKPWTVMCSYNALNGTLASQNRKLLTGILREEWGYQGAVVSDWGAVSDRKRALEAGMDIEMPYLGEENDRAVTKALKNGSLSREAFDQSIKHISDLYDKIAEGRKIREDRDAHGHHELAKKAAAESAVLLKNDGILPLKAEEKIALIGELAAKPRYQGAGSSKINPVKVDSPLEAFKKQKAAFDYARGYDLESRKTDEDLIAEAAEIAGRNKTAVVFAGLPDLFESEGYDRKNLFLPDSHRKLIEAVSEACSQVVVVLMCGAPVVVDFAEKVQGILLMYLGGEAVGSACGDLIFGRANPSGKLVETWPARVEDIPAGKFFACDTFNTEYRESIYTGYRYYDTFGVKTSFCFGYGLSYTSFEITEAQCQPIFKKGQSLKLDVSIRNTGQLFGAQVVQVYIGKKGLFRPKKELKGFQKIWLEPGQERQISFVFGNRDFACYSLDKKDWFIESGEYEISVGFSVEDIKRNIKVNVPGDGAESFSGIAEVYRNPALEGRGGFAPEEAEFETLFEGKIPKITHKPKPYGMDSVVRDLEESFVGRLLIKALMRSTGAEGRTEEEMQQDVMLAGLFDYPLREIAMARIMSLTQISGLIDVLNHRYLSGIRKLLQK